MKSILSDDVYLFTNDATGVGLFLCGNVPGELYATLDFGTGPGIECNFKSEHDWNGNGPYVDTEFYPGWLDHWGEPHNTVSPEIVARKLDLMLALNASVNLYMYFGGTNFGLMSGANGDSSSYSPELTSYDYDAPLSEAGDLTYKWGALRNVLGKYQKIPVYDVRNSTKKSFGNVIFTSRGSLTNAFQEITVRYSENDRPLTFEGLDLDYGFVLYRSQSVDGTLDLGGLEIAPVFSLME
jgi:beta-galactosidase